MYVSCSCSILSQMIVSQYAADRARKRVSHKFFFLVNKPYSKSMTATIMKMSMILRSTLWECCQSSYLSFPQSGSLYMMFDHSKNTKKKLLKAYRDSVNCPDSVKSIYDCYKDVSLKQMLNVSTLMNMQGLYMLPIADGDFFPDSTKEESYDLARR